MKQQFSRRKFLQYTGFAAGAAALAACAAPAAPAPVADSGSDAAAPAAEGEVLEAWSTQTGIGEEAMKAVFDNYNAQTDSGNTVEFTYIASTEGSQASEKLLTAVAGGNPPPLFRADRFTVAQFAQQGFFTEVTDLAEAAGVSEADFYPFAWEEAVYKDGLFALPFNTDTRGIWWNKDIFEEVGLDPETPPTTLDELREMTEALTIREDNGRITRYGFNPLYDQAWLYTWGFDFGGEFQDAETKRITFSDPKIIESMEFVKSFVDEIGVEELDAMLAACTGGACNDANDYFWTGQSAMTCSGNWKVAQSHRFKPDGNYGAAPMPGPDGPAPHASWAGGWSWAIPMGAADVEAAYDALNYACGPEGQLKYCTDAALIPTNIAASEDPFFRADPLHATFMDLLPVSHTRPPIPLGSKLWDMQFTAFRDEIPHGTKTPEEALTHIDDTINPELEELGFFS